MDPMGYPEDPPFFLLTISIHHLYLFVWCFSSMESPKTSAIDCNTRMLSNGNRQGHEMARHFSACLTHHRYMNGESIRIDAGIRMGKLWWAGVWPPVQNRKTQRRRGRRALFTWINVARRRSEDFKAPALEKERFLESCEIYHPQGDPPCLKKIPTILKWYSWFIFKTKSMNMIIATIHHY